MRLGVMGSCPPPSGRKAATAQAVQAFLPLRRRIATPVSALARNDVETAAKNLGAGAIHLPRVCEKNGVPAEGNALRGAVEKISIVAAKRLEVKA